MNFDDSFIKLMPEEGGYSNDPEDPGGETMWGITLRIARANGYAGAMKDLPQEKAKDIARREYWNPAGCDSVPSEVKFLMFDVAYNSGPHEAILLLQRTVDEHQDGILGPHTLMAVQSMNVLRLEARFLGYRLDMMNDLSTWQKFGRGWAQRVSELLEKV